MNQIVVRDGKRAKDRITVLPENVKAALEEHLEYVKRLHEKDLADGYGGYICPPPSPENTKGRIVSGYGSMFSRQRRCPKIRVAV